MYLKGSVFKHFKQGQDLCLNLSKAPSLQALNKAAIGARACERLPLYKEQKVLRLIKGSFHTNFENSPGLSKAPFTSLEQGREMCPDMSKAPSLQALNKAAICVLAYRRLSLYKLGTRPR